MARVPPSLTAISNGFKKVSRMACSVTQEQSPPMERCVVAQATVNRLNELEARQEELERLIIIERSKQTVKITEAQMRTFYEQALQAEPQMLITYFVKEIIVYEDRIEIIFNSPINTSPDGERGFCFYMRNIRLNRKMILMSFLI